MKKKLATISLLLISGGFIYFGVSSTPTYAADPTSEEISVAPGSHFTQDTIPRKDTSWGKQKGKHKNKKDTTWRKDTIPQ